MFAATDARAVYETISSCAVDCRIIFAWPTIIAAGIAKHFLDFRLPPEHLLDSFPHAHTFGVRYLNTVQPLM